MIDITLFLNGEDISTKADSHICRCYSTTNNQDIQSNIMTEGYRQIQHQRERETETERGVPATGLKRGYYSSDSSKLKELRVLFWMRGAVGSQC